MEGGCQDFAAEELRCVEIPELNKEAQQYWVILKGLLVLDIERTLDHEVYTFLCGDLLDGMDKMMRDQIQAIVFKNDGKDIVKMVGGWRGLLGWRTNHYSKNKPINDDSLYCFIPNVKTLSASKAGQETLKIQQQEVEDTAILFLGRARFCVAHFQTLANLRWAFSLKEIPCWA